MRSDYAAYPDRHQRVARAATALYEHSRKGLWWQRLWARLRRRPFHLLDLRAVETAVTITERTSAGVHTVPLSQIRGSENRARDFTPGFAPTYGQHRDRWLSVAMAMLLGTPLPPVLLIQIGEVYFVRDGHHRISVARALRYRALEAEVTRWQVVGPLPSTRPTAVTRPDPVLSL